MRGLIWVLARIQALPFLGLPGFLGRHLNRIRAFRESRARDGSGTLSSVWFHAASLGELEMLRPMLDDLVAMAVPVGVSVFSESALSGLKGLEGRTVYAGLSPREDHWESWFESYGVRKLVLAKYDFWPGLLRAARKRSAQVWVVNAEWRGSLRLVCRVFRWMREPLPELRFWVNAGEHESLKELRSRFGHRNVEIGMNPRFERVRRRIASLAGHSSLDRIEDWRKRIQELPRPVLMMGSAWIEDLDFVVPEIRKLPFSLVVVPHVVDEWNLGPMRRLLETALPRRSLLVPEMGVLVELYGAADRAFVGGGFGRGIHSTLEPAVCGLPVACGPEKVNRFPETRELRRRGALVVCENGVELSQWLLNPVAGRLNPEDLQNLSSDYQRILEQCL